MIVTVEISIYPMQLNYEKNILSFIDNMKSYKHLQIYTNAMSTQVSGEWSYVMDALKIELERVFDDSTLSPAILKIVNRKLPIEAGHLNFE